MIKRYNTLEYPQKIRSLNDYNDALKAIKEIVRNNHHIEKELWFRGVKDEAWFLKPSAYRPETYTNLGKESIYYSEFKRRSYPYLSEKLSDRIEDAWNWYFLMRHYGMPTRLLDWTTSALIALYFAVFEGNINNNDGAVWILDPFQLNSSSIKMDAIMYPSWKNQENNIVSKYLFSSELQELPMAIIPKYIDRRMEAQKSCFTVHGRYEDGLIDWNPIPEDYEKHLFKLIIDAKSFKPILQELYLSGIKHTSIYPGLEGVAKEIVNDFKDGIYH